MQPCAWETEGLLRKALDKLGPRQREVFLLVREEGLKRSEVSRLPGISPFSVKATMQHALGKMRKVVREKG
jgi:RNA polymerase sigma factor (sigma-70 family)